MKLSDIKAPESEFDIALKWPRSAFENFSNIPIADATYQVVGLLVKSAGFGEEDFKSFHHI